MQSIELYERGSAALAATRHVAEWDDRQRMTRGFRNGVLGGAALWIMIAAAAVIAT